MPERPSAARLDRGPVLHGPTLDELRAALAGPGGLGAADRSYDVLLAATAPAIDVARRAHRAALHRWLNAWGCRIRYPLPGEPDSFDRSLAAWWRRRSATLGPVREPLAELSDDKIDLIAAAYADLSGAAVAVDARATPHDGPTAAAGCPPSAALGHAVGPHDRPAPARWPDRDAFAAHLRLGRRWAQDLLTTAASTRPLPTDLDLLPR